MELTDEQRRALVQRDIRLAVGRALEDGDAWDVFYSPVADRIRIVCAELAAAQPGKVTRDLLAMSEGG